MAGEFGVTEGAVFRAACREGWHERAHEIEALARREAQKRAVKTVARRVEEALSLVDATKLAYAKGLKSGQVTVSASEMAQMLKLEQVLVGGPSERLAGETSEHRRSLAEIEAEMAALEPAEVDAILVADAIVAERLELPPGQDTAVSEPVAPGDTEADAVPSSMPDAASEAPSLPADVEAEAVAADADEAEPELDGKGFWRDQQPGLGDWSRADFAEQLERGPRERL